MRSSFIIGQRNLTQNHDVLRFRVEMNRIIFLVELIGLVASFSHISKSYYLDSQNHHSSHQSRQYLTYKPPKLMKRGPTTFIHKETESFSIYLSCQGIGISDCDKVLDHLVRASKRIENVLVIRNRIRFNATVSIAS